MITITKKLAIILSKLALILLVGWITIPYFLASFLWRSRLSQDTKLFVTLVSIVFIAVFLVSMNMQKTKQVAGIYMYENNQNR